MADFLRNLWSGAPSSNDNEFIGQVLDVGNSKYRVKRLIAEGNLLLDPLRIRLYICLLF